MNNRKLNTWNGVLNAVSTDLVAPFAVLFAVRLGASNFLTALLSSGPAIAALLVLIPASRWVDRQTDKKRVTAWLMAANRVFYLFMVAVPFLLPSTQAAVFVFLVAVMNAPGAVANAAWQGYMAQVFPAQERAQAFADRNKAMNLFGTATVLLAGIFLDHIGAAWGYQLMFFGAFLIAGAEILVFLKMVPPKHRTAEATPPEVPLAVDSVSVPALAEAAPELPRAWRRRGRFREIASDKTFVRYTLASLLFYFGWQTPWTLFSLYQVKELDANNTVLGLLTVLNTGGNLLGYGFWVRQIERKGNLKVQWMAASALVLVPFTYSVTGFVPRVDWFGVDASLYFIGALNILIGAALSGLILALFNSLLESTPEANRTVYLGYYNSVTTLTAVIAPIWGVALFEWWGYQAAFLVCAAQRIIGVGALVWLWRTSRKSASSRGRG